MSTPPERAKKTIGDKNETILKLVNFMKEKNKMKKEKQVQSPYENMSPENNERRKRNLVPQTTTSDFIEDISFDLNAPDYDQGEFEDDGAGAKIEEDIDSLKQFAKKQKVLA